MGLPIDLLDAGKVADSILGRFIADKDEREQAMAAVKMAFAARVPQWAQGAAIVISVFGFNIYLLLNLLGPSFFDKFTAWQPEPVAIWFLLIAMLYGERLGEVVKALKGVVELALEREKRRREAARQNS